MVLVRVVEMRVEFGIEFDGDEAVLGELGGIDETQVAAGAAEGTVVGGEEEGEAVAEGARVGVGDGETESCGERSGGVGILVVEEERVVVDEGAGAGGRNAKLAGEARDAAAEVGVSEEGEVAESEGGEVDGDVVSGGDGCGE